MTLLAVRGANSYAHAYGIVTAADITGFVAPSWPQITNDAQMASIHLLLQIKQTDGGSGQEISFDEADVRGMFHVPGHPGVLGIWLASSTVAGAVTDPINATTFDPSRYEVPDLTGQPYIGWFEG